jgi:hypothetical protein
VSLECAGTMTFVGPVRTAGAGWIGIR